MCISKPSREKTNTMKKHLKLAKATIWSIVVLLVACSNCTVAQQTNSIFPEQTFNRGAGTAEAEQLFALLSIEESGISTLVDGCMAAYDNSYSNSVDFDDALKLSNTSENTSFKRSNTLLAIERRRDIEQNDTLFVNLTGLRVKTYKWKLKLNYMVNPGRTGFLIDRYTQTTTPLNLHGETQYTFNVMNISASYDAARFLIVFNQLQLPKAAFVNVKATRVNNTNNKIEFAVSNEQGIANYEIEHSVDGINFSGAITGLAASNNSSYNSYNTIHTAATEKANWYRVKMTPFLGMNAYSAIVMVTAIEKTTDLGDASIAINPNPIINGKVNLMIKNFAKGLYNVSIVNANGQSVHQSTVTVVNANTVQKIDVAQTQKGVYYLIISDTKGFTKKLNFTNY
jgi:Secretion system C-terminal sorting domain